MNESLQTLLRAGGFFGAAFVLLFSPAFVALAAFGHPLWAVVLAGMLFLVTGLPFGAGMALFAEYQRSRFLKMRLVPSDETSLRQGSANHFMGVEGVGGWLFVTDRALRFKSHALNLQPHELTIPLAEITEAAPCRTAGLFPTGLLVTTTNGRSERFVVSGRKAWADAIHKAQEASRVAGDIAPLPANPGA